MTEKKLDEFIESLQEKSSKVSGKHNPISEKVENQRERLKIKNIYNLKKPLKGLYLFIAENYKKTPKYRYFIAISLAGQSSDFLVYLAKDFALQNDIKLLQYNIYPEHRRVNLLGLKEIIEVGKYEDIINILVEYQQFLKARMEKIKDTVIKDQKL